ncbi:MAG: HYR domain-containing protein, partial [Chthoniobacteraceae bacterium]
MKKFVLAWLAFVALLLAGGTDVYSQAITPTNQIPLFNGTSLSGLYPWFSTSGFSDPNQIFRVENGQLRVTGNAWGALTTNNRYRNYVMVLEFKWGDETFGSRLGLAKDAGIVFHSNGTEGAWSGLLMPGIQAQMIDGGIGDVILLKGTAPMSVTSRIEQVASGITPPNWNYRGGYRWKAGNSPVTFNQDVASVHWSGWDPSWQDVIGYRGQNVLESPDGQWNQMVVVANNDTYEIYLNGTKINEGTAVVPSEGKIQLEVEFAEFFVRRWELWPLGHAVGPIITMEQLPSGTSGLAYSQTVRAAGGSALTWSIPTGTLPPGLTLNPTTGQISGTPTASGTFSFTVRVTDNAGGQANQAFQLAVSAATGSLVTSGLVLHLDATQGVTTTGNTVTAWADASGNGNNVVAVSDPQRGTALTPTGLQSIRLDGVNDVLQRTGGLTNFPSGNANRTMFLVAKYNSSTWWAGIAYGTAASNQSFGLNVKHPSGELVLHGYGGGNDLVSTTPGIGAGWMVQSGLLNGGTATHFKDGTQIGQFAHTYNTGLTKLVIGAEIGNAGFAGMDVAAVLLYNRALSVSERADVEAYLRSRFLVDTTPPVVTVPANIVTEATGASGAVVNFTTSAVDNGSSVTTTNTPASGSVFPIGVTTVTTTAVDGAGNSAVGTFTVTVRDTTAPVITVPNPGPINHQIGTSFADPGATATDAVAGVVPLTSSTSVNSSVAGVYFLTYNFSDAALNAATQVTVTVNVGDFIGPVITVPGNIVTEATGSGGAVVTFSTSAVDAISGSAPTTSTPASGSMFPLGVTTVTATAVDAAGNSSSATFTVTVRDTTPPVITVPNPGPLTHEAGTPFVDPGATATDAVAGVVPRTSSTVVNGLVPGVYVLTYNFADASGNAAAQVTVTVNVVDTTPPVITVPADIIAEATGSGGATVTFSTSASDLVGGTRPTTNVPASGSVFPIGVTTVTSTAADAAGNSASTTFTVTVRDTTPPVITVPANFTVEVPDVNGGIVNFATSATDTVSGAVTTTDSPASGSIFSVGATTVTTTAVDAAGNTATRTFTVTAVYVPPPITPQTVIPLFSGNSADLLYTWTPALGIHPVTERFTVQNGILHVVGNEGGPLLSNDRYRDYVLVIEYKWGPRQWGNAVGKAKNSGLLLHSRGHEGGHENINMPGLEVQFAEGSAGDFLLEMGTDELDQLLPMSMTGTVGQVTCSGTPWNCRGGYRWVQNGTPIYLNQLYNTIHWYAWSPSWQDVTGYRGPVDHESPDGQWNQVVVNVQGGQIGLHLNGTKVNEILDCFPSQGKVQLEVEGSEFFVRRWELRPLGSLVGPSLRKDSLPAGTVNAPYSQQITAAAGNGTLSWSISAGILPDGLSLNAQTGALTGTPYEAGSFIFTATVTDNLGLTGSQQYQIVINPLSTTIPVTTGLVLHLDSTQGVTKTGNTVTAWADSSVNGNNVVAVSNPQHGTVLTPLGLPAIRLDGVDDQLQRTATLTGFPSGNTNRTMFVVTKYNSSTWWAGVAYGTAASNQAFGLNVKHPTGELVLQGYAGGNDLVSTTPGIGAGWMVQSALLNGGTATHFKDGTQIGQWVHTYNTAPSKLVIGAEIGGLGYVGMDVAAVVLYNRALSASERADVEAYLRSKYLVDTTPPVVTVPPNITTEATGSGGAVVNFSTSALDVVSGVITPTNTPASGSLFPLGTTTVTATAVDAAGNSASRTFTVTVRDTTPPVISVPATSTVEATGADGATVNFTSSATDIVSGSVVTLNSPAAGSLFPIGTTIVTTTAVDAAGNPANRTFSVVVRDTTAPVIAVPNPGPLIHEAGVAFVDPGATATDAVAGVVPLMSSTAVNGLVPGSYVLTYNFTDAALNAAAQVTVIVTVVDTTPPVVSVPANMIVEATGASGAVVNFATSATDIVSGSVTTVNTPASGSVFPLGATTVTATATDGAGNSASRTFTITVRDTTAPVISVPNPGPLTHEAGAPFVDPGATATDAVAGVVAVSSSTAV